MSANTKVTIDEVVLRKPRGYPYGDDEINIYLKASKISIWIGADGQVQIYDKGGPDLVHEFSIVQLLQEKAAKKELSSV